MISLSDFIPSLSQFLSPKTILVFVTLLIGHINCIQAILTTRVDTNGHQNGPFIPESPVQYLIDPTLLTQSSYSSLTSLQPIDLTSVGDGNFFQPNDPGRQFIPLGGDIGSTIARQILASFNIKDGQSVESPEESVDQGDEGETIKLINNNNKVSSISNGKLNQKIPKGAILIYRDGSEGDNDETDGGEVETTFSTLNSRDVEPTEKIKANEYEENEDESEGEGETIVKTSKPGRVVIKRIVKGKDGELTAIDWIQDKGHKKHGWKNLYHKEEWGDTQQKNDLVGDKGWKKRFRGDQDQDLKAIADRLSPKKRKSKKKSNKKKKKVKQNDDDVEVVKDDQVELQRVGNGYRIPQILWNYLSRQNGHEAPIEELKISKVA